MTNTTQREADERFYDELRRRMEALAKWNDVASRDSLVAHVRAAIDQSTQQVAPEAPTCQWPTCQPVEVQQKVAKEVHAELYGGAPAATDQPSAGQVDCAGCEGSPSSENNPCAVCGRASLTPTAPQAASQQAGLDFETIQRIGKRAEFIREKLGEAVRWCYANAGADKTPDGLLEDIAERVEWIRRDAETLAQQGAPQAATTASDGGFVEGAFQLIYQAYSTPLDKFSTDGAAYQHMRGLVTKAFSLLQKATRRAPVQAAQPALPETAWTRKDFIERIVLAVAEIPDRNSPEDQPEMMLVTDRELRNIVQSVFERADEDGGLAAPGAAQTTDVRDAARYRILRQHVAPFDVAISMCVPAKDIPPEQTIEESIDMLCDQALEADRAAIALAAHGAAQTTDAREGGA